VGAVAEPASAKHRGRLDQILAGSGLAERAVKSTVLRESRTSDHGAVIVELSEAPATAT
jgi:exonuclease III